jgi:hypothetical protein
MYMTEQLYDKTKYKFKLYSPSKIGDKSLDGYNEFLEKDYQGNFPTKEMAIRAGKLFFWYQVVDTSNKQVVGYNIRKF